MRIPNCEAEAVISSPSGRFIFKSFGALRCSIRAVRDRVFQVAESHLIVGDTRMTRARTGLEPCTFANNSEESPLRAPYFGIPTFRASPGSPVLTFI
jgi:hypothetical protein